MASQAWAQLQADEAALRRSAQARLVFAPVGWRSSGKSLGESLGESTRESTRASTQESTREPEGEPENRMPAKRPRCEGGAVAHADAAGMALTTDALPLTLYKDKRVWSTGVEEDGRAWTTYGVEGGKMTRSERTAPTGLQGRTSREQAAQEALAQVRKKLRAGYTLERPGADPSERATDAASVPLPMLAVDWHKLKRPQAFVGDATYAQPKLDGIRALANTRTGKLYSRTGKLLTGLPHIEDALRVAADAATPPAEWLDGEIYRHGMDFQDIVGAARKKQADGRSWDLEYHVFDTVRPDLGFENRLRMLSQWTHVTQKLSPRHRGVIVQVHTEPITADTVDDLQRQVDELVTKYERDGYEGAILRRNAPYEPGKRSLTLAKAKNFRQEEFAVVRLTRRERQTGPAIAATVVAQTDDGQQFEATLGGTEAQRREMWSQRDQYDRDNYVVSVRFQELTSAGIPRFPTVVGFRHPDDR